MCGTSTGGKNGQGKIYKLNAYEYVNNCAQSLCKSNNNMYP